MNILFIGDIVGKPGRKAVAELLPGFIVDKKIDLVVANAENAAGGSGLNSKCANLFFAKGVDILTSGDHIFKRRDVFDIIDNPYILRPENLPPRTPGKGHCVIKKNGIKIGVLNLQGRVFMRPIECPFRAAEVAVKLLKKEADVILVDIHAEATSEKIALSCFLDTKVSLVAGTHTHVQTADEKISAAGTAYITDVGMTGPCDSVIGRNKESVIERFITGMPTRFEVADDDIQMQGVIVTINELTAKATAIKRIKECLS